MTTYDQEELLIAIGTLEERLSRVEDGVMSLAKAIENLAGLVEQIAWGQGIRPEGVK